MGHEELHALYHLLKRSRYDVLQVHLGGRWSTPFSFTPCDPHAASQAVLMVRRMYGAETTRLRHARRARLRINRSTSTGAVVVTLLPSGEQVVINVADGKPISGLPYLSDEVLEAIKAAIPREDTA